MALPSRHRVIGPLDLVMQPPVMAGEFPPSSDATAIGPRDRHKSYACLFAEVLIGLGLVVHPPK